jgi:hypothetical protein
MAWMDFARRMAAREQVRRHLDLPVALALNGAMRYSHRWRIDVIPASSDERRSGYRD